MYRLLRPLFFRLDAERAHDLTISSLARSSRHPGALTLLRAAFTVRDPRLEVSAFGLRFPNPVGLAAGMDKDARALPAWDALGFGHAELGTVTALPQPGNPRPRLFRLPDDEALLNRMGFNNEGAEAVAARLASGEREAKGAELAAFRIGINVGKSRAVPLERALDDYARSLGTLWEHADYLVLNVSSPNTPGLRELQARGPLGELLALTDELVERAPKPVLVKVAPDLPLEGLEAIVELTAAHRVAGLIATNTTVSREGLSRDPGEAGGLSGRPLAPLALAALRYLRANSALPIVSVGGIMGPRDAVARIRAGASLVQLYTGYVYRGPGLVRAILRALVAEIEREGLQGAEQLIGLDAHA